MVCTVLLALSDRIADTTQVVHNLPTALPLLVASEMVTLRPSIPDRMTHTSTMPPDSITV